MAMNEQKNDLRKEFIKHLLGHVVVGVVEVDAPLFSPQCEPALSQTNLYMILRVPTSAF